MNQQFVAEKINFYKFYNRMRNLHKIVFSFLKLNSIQLLDAPLNLNKSLSYFMTSILISKAIAMKSAIPIQSQLSHCLQINLYS